MSRKRILTAGFICLLGLVTVLLYVIFKPEPIWEVNEKQLYEALEAGPDLNGKRIGTEQFAKLMPFEWDTIYSFPPYYPKDQVAKEIGIPNFPVLESVNEGTNQTIFMHKGKVICYVYGYPENSGLYIGFGPSSMDADYKVLLKRSDMGNGTVKFERSEAGIWGLMFYSGIDL